MRALAIDPVMCGRDGADTTVELTFVQLKKARPNRKRIGRIDGMPIRDADVPRIAPITPTRELRVLQSSRPVWGRYDAVRCAGHVRTAPAPACMRCAAPATVAAVALDSVACRRAAHGTSSTVGYSVSTANARGPSVRPFRSPFRSMRDGVRGRPVCLPDELAGDARAALEVALRKERCVAAPRPRPLRACRSVGAIIAKHGAGADRACLSAFGRSGPNGYSVRTPRLRRGGSALL